MISKIKADIAVNYSLVSKFVCINYRIGNYAYYKNNFLLIVFYKITNAIVRVISNSEIHPKAIIGEGMRIEHGAQGVVIHSSARIGSNSRIFHQTTIGIKGVQVNEKAATIGNNMVLGVGGKIIGDIIIGDNVRIGANSVITKDIPNNSVVVGVNKIIG